MTTHLDLLLVFGIVAASIHWLFARSSIMSWLWSRARGWFGNLLACPACSGTWIGMGLYAVGMRPVVFDSPHTFAPLLTFACTAFLGMFLAPVFEAVLLWGLTVSAIAPVDAPPTDSV